VNIGLILSKIGEEHFRRLKIEEEHFRTEELEN
jgi:hypothetical protein